MIDYIENNRDGKEQFAWLLRVLAEDRMSSVRSTMLELLDIGYSGDHAKEIEPYKHRLIKLVLNYFKGGNFYVSNAFIWQLKELGVNWPELEIISKGIISSRGY